MNGGGNKLRSFDVVIKGGKPWGLGLSGGSDGTPLVVAEVERGGKAEAAGALRIGDQVLRINDVHCSSLATAEQLVQSAFRTLTLTVWRGNVENAERQQRHSPPHDTERAPVTTISSVGTPIRQGSQFRSSMRIATGNSALPEISGGGVSRSASYHDESRRKAIGGGAPLPRYSAAAASQLKGKRRAAEMSSAPLYHRHLVHSNKMKIGGVETPAASAAIENIYENVVGGEPAAPSLKSGVGARPALERERRSIRKLTKDSGYETSPYSESSDYANMEWLSDGQHSERGLVSPSPTRQPSTFNPYWDNEHEALMTYPPPPPPPSHFQHQRASWNALHQHKAGAYSGSRIPPPAAAASGMSRKQSGGTVLARDSRDIPDLVGGPRKLPPPPPHADEPGWMSTASRCCYLDPYHHHHQSQGRYSSTDSLSSCYSSGTGGGGGTTTSGGCYNHHHHQQGSSKVVVSSAKSVPSLFTQQQQQQRTSSSGGRTEESSSSSMNRSTPNLDRDFCDHGAMVVNRKFKKASVYEALASKSGLDFAPTVQGRFDGGSHPFLVAHHHQRSSSSSGCQQQPQVHHHHRQVSNQSTASDCTASSSSCHSRQASSYSEDDGRVTSPRSEEDLSENGFWCPSRSPGSPPPPQPPVRDGSSLKYYLKSGGELPSPDKWFFLGGENGPGGGGGQPAWSEVPQSQDKLVARSRKYQQQLRTVLEKSERVVVVDDPRLIMTFQSQFIVNRQALVTVADKEDSSTCPPPKQQQQFHEMEKGEEEKERQDVDCWWQLTGELGGGGGRHRRQSPPKSCSEATDVQRQDDTPLLDRLRLESRQWSDCGGGGLERQGGGRDSITSTTSSQETLKWHGSNSDISSVHSDKQQPRPSKESVVHSARVKPPQRHNSESVLYYGGGCEELPAATSPSRTNNNRESPSRHQAMSTEELDDASTSPPPLPRKMRQQQQQQWSEQVQKNNMINNQKMQVRTSGAGVAPCSSSVRTSGGGSLAREEIQPPVSPEFAKPLSVAERIQDLERQVRKVRSSQRFSPNGTTPPSRHLETTRMAYLDPEKKLKVSDPELKAIQKRAVRSFFERQTAAIKNNSPPTRGGGGGESNVVLSRRLAQSLPRDYFHEFKRLQQQAAAQNDERKSGGGSRRIPVTVDRDIPKSEVPSRGPNWSPPLSSSSSSSFRYHVSTERLSTSSRSSSSSTVSSSCCSSASSATPTASSPVQQLPEAASVSQDVSLPATSLRSSQSQPHGTGDRRLPPATVDSVVSPSRSNSFRRVSTESTSSVVQAWQEEKEAPPETELQKMDESSRSLSPEGFNSPRSRRRRLLLLTTEPERGVLGLCPSVSCPSLSSRCSSPDLPLPPPPPKLSDDDEALFIDEEEPLPPPPSLSEISGVLLLDEDDDHHHRNFLLDVESALEEPSFLCQVVVSSSSLPDAVADETASHLMETPVSPNSWEQWHNIRRPNTTLVFHSKTLKQQELPDLVSRGPSGTGGSTESLESVASRNSGKQEETNPSTTTPSGSADSGIESDSHQQQRILSSYQCLDVPGVQEATTQTTPRHQQQQKRLEELECERLSRDLLSHLSVPAADMKTMADYMEGLLELGSEDERVRRRASSSGRFSGDRPELPPKSVPLPSDSAYFTTSESKARFLARYSKDVVQQQSQLMHDIGSDTELAKKKEELVDSIARKLKVLRMEHMAIREEIRLNEDLGNSLCGRVEQLARPNEADKFKLHVEEVEKITSLLLGLSGRLARAQNALMTLPLDANPEEKKLLEAKRNKLHEQHEEAKKLKENIDRRSCHVSDFLHKYLSTDEYADYDHFVKMKAKLLMDCREIDDKIKLGEEQMAALKLNLRL